ncbi:MAG: glycoside hydrolase family 3 C-terminal domain-containing protein [Pseudobutyrivibrio sp.]|nr:glycoside hydrolase family 3 C-terminal domain-containing protein [Pseudobutyrivibrio sp.]
MKKWSRMKFQPNRPLYEGKYVTASKEHIELSKEAAREGIVLLKNEDKTLPLAKNKPVVLLGKGTFDYVKGGGGSGDVYTKFVHSLYDGVSQLGIKTFGPADDFYKKYVSDCYDKGDAPGMIPEPVLPTDVLEAAKSFSDTAILTFSRFSGEGWDRSDVECNNEFNPWETETSMPKIAGKIYPDKDFYLTAEEKTLLDQAKKTFKNLILVLNVGGMMDLRFVKESPEIKSAIFAWQGGMEGGCAMADVLFGDVNPSGKLPDTFAGRLEDYPSTADFHESFDYVNYTEDIFVGYRYFETFEDKKDLVTYPFGYGLSYTEFDICYQGMTEGNLLKFRVSVTNVGKVAGKEVVGIYVSEPAGKLGKAARHLVAFDKTRLLAPGETQVMVLTVDPYYFASFDDTGKVQEAAYVLEQGEYKFYLGSNVRTASLLPDVYQVDETKVLCQLSHKCAPVSLPKRLLSDGSYEMLPQGSPRDINECIFEKYESGKEEALTPALRGIEMGYLMNPYKVDHPFEEVAEGKISLEEFMEQLSDEDLIHLTGGQPNLGVSNTWGMGNLPEYGIPTATTADGPAGVRLNADCGIPTTAWPCSTMLASTWNQELIERVGKAGGEELKENNLQIWLTPAVNIHRNPQCGRNFEYYSEDPFLTGKMAAAMVRGIQSNNVACSVKHFATNNKETNRKHCDSRVSERALREIYLKQFEIIVKESHPITIMSSYNALNGYRVSENKELLTGILKEEWLYDGMVTSDWWTRGEHYKEILAGNDVKMATGYPDRVKRAMEMGALSREDILPCAKRVLSMILKMD